mmetsp:Transcript_7356/g.12372  ORF Transcript_7356/g.12372 Transcript_7356/m.12372 type:complete len:276 (+) Transcript_7356:3763-4590(+)
MIMSSSRLKAHSLKALSLFTPLKKAVLLPVLQETSYNASGTNADESPSMYSVILCKSGNPPRGAKALVSTLRLISCRQERIIICSFVRIRRDQRPTVVVAMARLKFDATITEDIVELLPAMAWNISFPASDVVGKGSLLKNSFNSLPCSKPSLFKGESKNTESMVIIIMASRKKPLARRTRIEGPNPLLNISFQSDSPCRRKTTFLIDFLTPVLRRRSLQGLCLGPNFLLSLDAIMNQEPSVYIIIFRMMFLIRTFSSSRLANANRQTPKRREQS